MVFPSRAALTSKYCVEYAATSRAVGLLQFGFDIIVVGSILTWHEDKVEQGSLHIGIQYPAVRGQVQYGSWTHWGCTDTELVQDLVSCLNNNPRSWLEGYTELRAVDQARVNAAMDTGVIAPEDICGEVRIHLAPLPSALDKRRKRDMADLAKMRQHLQRSRHMTSN
ncbi:hypothetical protein K438DRAFT_1752014 [Mycena galopus ATCC 62051]|nr:hypothetical protein K438DRAFT_1752014 [Mycena galopus ATCC 62051]